MRIRDKIIWFAGYCEGEGCFNFYRHSVRIHISSTDKDSLKKCKEFFGGNIYNVNRTKFKPTWKDQYQLVIHGEKAISLMLSIYSLMSQRRKIKIKEVVNKWKNINQYKKLPNHIGRKINAKLVIAIRKDYASGKYTYLQLSN